MSSDRQDSEPRLVPGTHPAQELTVAAGPPQERRFWVRAGVLAALGVVLLGVLGSALLSISHAPTPHHVSLGYVGPAGTGQALADRGAGALQVRTYGSRDAAVSGVRRMDVYGALVAGAGGVEVLKSTAASPQVANILTALLTTTAAGATPTITELSPLPPDDSGGGSLGVLLQVAVPVGTVGALGLGRLVPRYRANWARGELPVLFLALYGLCVGGGLSVLARVFGVGDQVSLGKLALSLALINLAATASISALVSLVGIAGSAVGGVLYFLLGVPISGAATALPLMPVAWRDLGQALPPGAGATLLRRVLYFPDAPVAPALLTLGLYAGFGALVLGLVNIAADARRRHSLANLP